MANLVRYLIVLVMLTVLPVHGEWSKPMNCRISGNGGKLCIELTGKNPRIYDYGVNFSTGKYRTLEFVYTAVGMPKTFSGNLFFSRGNESFSAQRRIPLRNLSGDGNQHKIKLVLPKSWKQAGKVTALRLDPADGVDKGTLILHRIEFVKVTGAGNATWDKTNDFAGWGSPLRAALSRKNGCLVMNIQGASPRICNYDLAVQSALYREIEIRYRATGIPENTTGNIFFYHDGDKNFTAGKRIPLRRIRNDGKWHVLKVNLPASWHSGKQVNALRFDPADQAVKGKFEIEWIRLTAGSVRSKEESGDVSWNAVNPVIPTGSGRDQALPKPYWSGKMIFSPEDKGHRGFYFSLRKRFDVPEKLTRALLQITADDRFAVWINGKKVLDRMDDHAWYKPVKLDVLKYLLLGNKNLICITYENISGPGGVLLELGMVDASGGVHRVVSDEKFHVAKTPSDESWLTASYDDSAWKTVCTAPAPPVPPWSRILPFKDFSKFVPAKVLGISVPKLAVAGKPFRLTLKLSTDTAMPAQKLKVALFSLPNLISLPEKVIELTDIPAGESLVTVDLPLPRYFSDCRMKFILSPSVLMPNRTIAGEFSYQGVPLKEKNPGFEVRSTPFGARLFVDGKLTYMLTGNVHVGDVRSRSRLHEIPANFRTCHIKMNAPHKQWIRSLDGEYDFSVIDRFAESRLEIDPNIFLIFSIELPLPHKFAKDFTGEISRRADGSEFRSSALAVHPASERNREIIVKALTALVKYCEKAPYASRIAGFLLADGETMEWQYWGSSRAARIGSPVDYSPGALKHYRKVTGMNMPSPKARLKANAGLFYHPETQKDLIRCNEYFSDVIAETLLLYCRTMKQAMLVPKLVGVYYGYHFEYANGTWRRQMGGHNRLREVLDSNAVDFICSPPSYTSRNLGNSGADMKPFASIEQAGVLSIIDDDTRTHTIGYNGYFQTLTRDQTQSIIRRNLGQYLCRQEALWLLPLQEGREFDDPATLKDLKKFKKASEFQVKTGVSRRPEIAVVVDERSYDLLAPDCMVERHEPCAYYLPDGKVRQDVRRRNRLTGNLISGTIERLAKVGAPADYLLSTDVRKNLDRYKLWIFLDVFRYDDEFLKAVKALRQRKVTLVWCYAPGWIRNGKARETNMETLTGIQLKKLDKPGSPAVVFTKNSAIGLLMGYPEMVSPRFQVDDQAATVHGTYHDIGTPAIAEKKTGNAVSWFFGGNCIATPVLRSLARDAGVHIYSETGDTLFANDRFIAFHAASAGNKRISLPRQSEVWELFSGTRIAENVKEFSFDAALHESRIFFLGNLKELDKKNK